MMPHHTVWKSSSTTTKCRAGFNKSAKTTNGRSLYDYLLVGPKQQPDLLEILIQFLLHRIILSGDITKMYRQIELNEKNRNFHQKFWRSGQRKQSRSTVRHESDRVFSSSNHAIRALRDTAEDALSSHCKNSLLNSFYVDDLLGGSALRDLPGFANAKLQARRKRRQQALPDCWPELQDLFDEETTEPATAPKPNLIPRSLHCRREQIPDPIYPLTQTWTSSRRNPHQEGERPISQHLQRWTRLKLMSRTDSKVR